MLSAVVPAPPAPVMSSEAGVAAATALAALLAT